MDKKQRQRKRNRRLKWNDIKLKICIAINNYTTDKIMCLMEDNLILIQEMMLENGIIRPEEEKSEEVEDSN